MSFSLICRVRGLGSLQGKVLLLLRGGRNAGLLSLLLLWSFPLSLDLRSLNDRDWCRDLSASWARTSFDGVCSVVGMSSSSIVFPRPLGGGVTTKLRTEMPCRCRSLRFYESPTVSYYYNCMSEKINVYRTYRWKQPWSLTTTASPIIVQAARGLLCQRHGAGLAS